MSCPKLVLSRRAQGDISAILRYTAERWGMPQLLAYRQKLDQALQRLRQDPLLGKVDQSLPETYRLWLVGSHVIVYRLKPDCIQVIRVLHQRMMVARHLTSS